MTPSEIAREVGGIIGGTARAWPDAGLDLYTSAQTGSTFSVPAGSDAGTVRAALAAHLQLWRGFGRTDDGAEPAAVALARRALLVRPVPAVVRAVHDILGAPGDPRRIYAGECLYLAPPAFMSAQYLGPRGCNLSALRAAGLLFCGDLVAAGSGEAGAAGPGAAA